MRVVRCFPAQNIVACYDEAPGGGNIEDISAPCNAPAKSPHLYPHLVYWHVDFFQYELAMPLQNKTVTHASLAGKTLWYGTNAQSGGLKNGTTTDPGGIRVKAMGNLRVQNITLVTHNLGYVPAFYVAYAGRMMPCGTVVQMQGADRGRFVSAFATSSIIGLRETTISSDLAISAVNRNYQVLVFRNPAPNPALPLAGLQPDLINLWLGRGKIDTKKQYLRRTLAAESNFDLDRGRTVDYRGGGIRFASGGITTDFGPYSGSFSGPAFIPVGV